jgi:SAM-dependent methyltransferase
MATSPSPTPDSGVAYVFDRGQTDQARLQRIAALFAAEAREACLRAGLASGNRAVDIGCGPLGALPVLAELVGPAGTVVGLDVSPEAVAQARRALDARGLDRVALLQADANAADPAAVAAAAGSPGPFDLAFCRLVLMHQADPAATLRRAAALLRPGGRLVMADFLDDPAYPRTTPPVPALERIWTLTYAAIGRAGGTPDVARRYPALCAAAGLRLVEQRGTFLLLDDAAALPAFGRSYVASLRRRLVALGLATDAELDALLRELDAVETGALRAPTGPLSVVAIAEVPAATDGAPYAP